MAIKKEEEKRMQYVDEAHLQMKTTKRSKKTELPSLYTSIMYLNSTIRDDNKRCE